MAKYFFIASIFLIPLSASAKETALSVIKKMNEILGKESISYSGKGKMPDGNPCSLFVGSSNFDFRVIGEGGEDSRPPVLTYEGGLALNNYDPNSAKAHTFKVFEVSEEGNLLTLKIQAEEAQPYENFVFQHDINVTLRKKDEGKGIFKRKAGIVSGTIASKLINGQIRRDLDQLRIGICTL